MTAPHLSVILPSYNSASKLAANLPLLKGYLETLKLSYEIIVVDDGSPDDGATRQAVEAAGCRYETNPVNTGKGAALRRGMLAASGRYRLFTDADLPYELETIERFVWYLAEKEFHIVIGDRNLPGSIYYDGIPINRQWGSRFFSFIIGRFVTTGFHDTQCGIKAFRGEVAEDIFSVARIDRFAIDVELLYIALKRNYDIKRLPVKLRGWEASSVRLIADSLLMLRDLFAIRFNFTRGLYNPHQPVDQSIDSYPGTLELDD